MSDKNAVIIECAESAVVYMQEFVRVGIKNADPPLSPDTVMKCLQTVSLINTWILRWSYGDEIPPDAVTEDDFPF